MFCLAAIFLLLALPVIFFFTHILYRDKSSQPLPSPPGLPLIGHLHLLGTLPHRSLHKLSQAYGPIIQLRLGLVPTVVVSTAEMAEWFLKTYDSTFASKPTTQLIEYISYGGKGVGSSKYGGYWRNVRKLCTLHLLSVSKVDSFKHLRQKEMRGLVKDLRAASAVHEVVNISALIGSVIEKITYQMIFGSEKKEILDLKPCVEEALRLAVAFNIADFIPMAKAIDFQGFKRRMKDVRKTLDHFLEKIIHEHEQDSIGQQEHHKGFIDVMLSMMKSNSSADEEKLDKTNIKAITIDMLTGGIETTATTIDWVLTELFMHPEIMKQVQDELLTVVGLDRLVEESDLEKLVYLNMVVKETMRLHPVSPLLPPRESAEDVRIQGYHIPKGTWIIINAWAIGQEVNAWNNNAEEFYPARFINKDIDIRGHDIQLIPFGYGRRKCPGIEMGIRVIHFILAQVLHCFCLELPDGMPPKDVDMGEKFGMTMEKASPLQVVPIYRLRVNNV